MPIAQNFINIPHRPLLKPACLPFGHDPSVEIGLSPADWYHIGHNSESIWGRYDDVIKWKHFPRYWPFVRGIHRSPVNSLHKGQWRRALMFSLIGAWINGKVNNRDGGDLRRHRAHYDVTAINDSSLGCLRYVTSPAFYCFIYQSTPHTPHPHPHPPHTLQWCLISYKNCVFPDPILNIFCFEYDMDLIVNGKFYKTTSKCILILNCKCMNKGLRYAR